MLKVAMIGHVDHGKSTLIGRLLADSGFTKTERRERVRTYCESTGRRFEYAFLLDALEEEQAQGITIDVTEVPWRFNDREYLFVDTPGHREFLKKMIGGASRVDVAVLMVDVVEGLTESFYRQVQVLKLLGTDRRLVVVNKMDLVQYENDAYSRIESAVRAVLTGQDIILPAAAWPGVNLFARATTEMPWYSGPSFVDALHLVENRASEQAPALRFFVQDVYRFDDRRIYAGRVEAGLLSVGDELQFFPGAERARVTSIDGVDGALPTAATGSAVGITLDRPLYLDRGSLGFWPDAPPVMADHVRGDLFWLDPAPLKAGDRVKVKMGTAATSATVTRVIHEVDDALATREAGKVSLFGRVEFKFDRTWAFDPFETCESSGRFVIAKDGRVSGGGRWLAPADEVFTGGEVFWLTGYSGAGKSTLAESLATHLRAEGESVIVIDGDSLRRGLCRDLGFTLNDRTENLRRAAEVARLLSDHGVTVITALITPLAGQRQMAREIVGADRFREVFVDCPLSVCEDRDVKGLYARARRGEISDFTGVDSPFESPTRPDLHVRTDIHSLEESLQQIITSRRNSENHRTDQNR